MVDRSLLAGEKDYQVKPQKAVGSIKGKTEGIIVPTRQQLLLVLGFELYQARRRNLGQLLPGYGQEQPPFPNVID